ncbi:efflux RND transporter periplasmic adaptor subunit [Chroococcidiopsis sp.]|uniref:efflux RND transporter periplasmic adaptor subunit n=1 Tax=Chroococcidiopsis sp. TaxID=3088168 RepID=UPI003F3EA192
MIRSHPLFSRAVLTTLVAAPLGIMAVLAIAVLVPATKNPESKIYASGIGYPALQRLTGKPIAVKTIPVAPKTLEDNVAAPGESVALHKIDLRPQVSGPVEQVYVEEGQSVRRGQPLVQFQQEAYKNAVDAARNNAAISEMALLNLQKSAPVKLAKLKTDVELAKHRLAIASTKVQDMNSLVEKELKDQVVDGEHRLAIAEKKLQQMSSLVQAGAISKFQLYDIQDSYLARKKDLDSTKRQTINAQIQLYGSQDFYTTLQQNLLGAQQELAHTQQEIDNELGNARLKLQNDKIALQNALKNLHNTVLYAPMDGLVSWVNIDRGELAGVRASRPLVSISKDFAIRAYIDQAQINAIKVGDLATVRLMSYPGRTFQGKVIRLNPTILTSAGKRPKGGIDRRYTYSVWIAVDDLQMAAGLQGYVQFNKDKANLAIPESAVIHLSGGEGMVMVAEAGQAVVKPVQMGRIFDNQREILAGLTPGEQVVLSPRGINPGDRLEVKSQKSEVKSQN